MYSLESSEPWQRYREEDIRQEREEQKLIVRIKCHKEYRPKYNNYPPRQKKDTEYHRAIGK